MTEQSIYYQAQYDDDDPRPPIDFPIAFDIPEQFAIIRCVGGRPTRFEHAPYLHLTRPSCLILTFLFLAIWSGSPMSERAGTFAALAVLRLGPKLPKLPKLQYNLRCVRAPRGLRENLIWTLLVPGDTGARAQARMRMHTSASYVRN